MKIMTSPSLLAADPLNLERDIRRAEAAGADMLHVDIMDGVYVPNITLGLPFVKAARKLTSLPLDVHMMTVCPGKYIDTLADFGADIVSFHNDIAPESEVIEILEHIRACGMKSAIAISPDVAASEAIKFIDHVDMILVMTVQPGFGGQKFRDISVKIREIRSVVIASGRDIDIEVDGGINAETAALTAEAGVNVFVAGTYLFGAPDMAVAMSELVKSAENAVK